MTTTPEPRHALLVEDTVPLARTYVEFLKAAGYTCDHVETGRKALNALKRAMPDVMLLDIKLPDMSGLEVLDRMAEMRPHCPVVVITAHGSIKLAVDAMRAGAADFLMKPFNGPRLKAALANLFERIEIAGAPAAAPRLVVDQAKCGPAGTSDDGSFAGFIGSSPAMRAVFRVVEAAAASKASVFITGESGTGKEVAAEAIHRLSARRDHPIVALNCAAVPRELMESEIFGHVKGSFSGAVADRDGAATLANGGTLFLDELCDMHVDLQAKLLRFLQSESFRRVGGAELEKVDLRFIAATNKEPLEEVAEGRLREDLYYRLHVIPIYMPPLRERGEDVIDLAKHFLAALALEEGKPFTGLSEDVKTAFRAYDWPGNVRQLQNVIRNIVVMNTGETVTLDMLPPPLNRVAIRAPSRPSGSGLPRCRRLQHHPPTSSG
jgi:two-component system repressor protein LuxO